MIHVILFLLGRVDYIVKPKPESQPIQWLDMKEENRPAMSDKTRRVERETRTKVTTNAPMSTLGEPQVESAPSPGGQPRQQQRPQQTQSPGVAKNIADLRSEISPDSLYVSSGKREAAQSSSNSNTNFLNTMSPASRQQLQNYMPKELQIGDVAALNTDQNLYFTFYRRMAEKVIWPWIQNVTTGFEKLKREGQLPYSDKVWTTIVEVILDPQGKVLSVTPLQLSGQWEIDGAPNKAFKQARNFPNPPTEMVGEDGYIRIRYKFVVYYSPQGMGGPN